jgi:hypothetical protein
MMGFDERMNECCWRSARMVAEKALVDETEEGRFVEGTSGHQRKKSQAEHV